jgi:transcriptional regulator with XRE-family HTH domain
MKLALAGHLRRRRQARHVSQVDLASQLGSSQSRIAKMEAADASVSLDLLVRALLALGETSRGLARVLGRPAA